MSDRRTFLGAGLALAGTCALPRLAHASTGLALRPSPRRIALIEGGASNIVVASSGVSWCWSLVARADAVRSPTAR